MMTGTRLGKTIQVIARVIEGKRELLASGQSDGFSTATLIVCPVSLIAQWAAEIRSFTLHPNVIEYHGPRRPRDPDVLASADFVITSYSTLETEHRILTLPRSGKSKTAPLAALFQVKWRRAVLDEAHCIKVSTKKQAVACFHIEAVFRWCVTGTPIQNGVEDMYSYLRFLRIAPFDDRIKFNSHISRPFKSGKTQDALRALHTVLKSVMLRRAKGAVSLPSKTVLIVKCIFDERERALYTSLERELQDDVARALASKKFATVLVSLLRLRQACCHERLVPAHEIKAELLELNEEFSGSPVCTIEECDAELSSLTGGTEREDRHPVVTAHAVSGTKTGRLSAKVRKTIELLREIQARPGSEKTVIFSQFLTMLDVLHEELQAHGFRCVRYDGNMTKSQRDASVREIQLSSRCDCILVSFKAGGVGLNLTSCNNVILTDLWWNPALEEQAFDRTHRLGQVKNVHVYKLVTERSIEDRILALQAKKRLIATRALGSDDVAMSRADVVSLFEKVEAERP
ncbi:hypothetical protein FA95DRAFT_510081 [Auriscalpium vulgare]|uniref:Uncharacterized protein n=1 Tax=Auriscalpium vulgare TaxID=40419 RepID=A0ACB8RF80_9AGAM|nr:hypothetical protein FA95DRAFT_510081 [Auriscalpium vulgare]